MHNTLVKHTRCTGRCTMQIRNPVVCDSGKRSLYKKTPLVVEHGFLLTWFVGLSANATYGGSDGIMSTAESKSPYPCFSRAKS